MRLAAAASRTAIALSASLRGIDGPVNAITDEMNARVPWLWWPLPVPSARAPLPLAVHGLFAIHAAVVWAAAGAAGIRVRPGPAIAGASATWVLFTGAWDRRADVVHHAGRLRPGRHRLGVRAPGSPAGTLRARAH